MTSLLAESSRSNGGDGEKSLPFPYTSRTRNTEILKFKEPQEAMFSNNYFIDRETEERWTDFGPGF
jgi:hypothetical protein